VSTQPYDAAVIGAGHNGLVASAYLGRAGLRVLVLEGTERIGGTLGDVEVAPGIRAPALFHTVGRLRPSVIRDLRLETHGLRLIHPEVRAVAPQPDGDGLVFWSDPARTAAGLRRLSTKDADAYPSFDQKVRALASFLAHLNAVTPPDLKSPSIGDALSGVKLGKAFRDLGTRAGREVIRAIPMAVADFVGEAFETDSVRAAVASRAVLFTAMGPWSAGTALVLLSDSAGNDGGAIGQTVFAAGGTNALARALAGAAADAGVEIRTNADVRLIKSRAGRATGVVLSSGEEIVARTVVSSADPKRTLTRLVDPVELGPDLLWRAGNIRTPGCTAKVNLALSGLPAFTGAGEVRGLLHGRILIAPGIDHLERAFDASKYGRASQEPFLEATIPSLGDPSLVPGDGHVMSVLVQWTPYLLRDSDWDAEREGLGDLVLKTLEDYAPGLSDLVVARQVLTPLDLEREYGLTQGHTLHGEPGLDQWFAWRPMLGHARYRFGLDGLYLCGSGAHPGGGVTGAPGANAAREILRDLRSRGR